MTLGAVTAVNMEVGSGGLGYIDLKNNAAADFHARLSVNAASNLSMFTTSGPGSIFIGASNNSNNIIVTPSGNVAVGAALSNNQLIYFGTTPSNLVITNPRRFNVNGPMTTGTIFIGSGVYNSTVSSNTIINGTGYTANVIFSDGGNGIFADYGDVVIRYGNTSDKYIWCDRGGQVTLNAPLQVNSTWGTSGFGVVNGWMTVAGSGTPRCALDVKGFASTFVDTVATPGDRYSWSGASITPAGNPFIGIGIFSAGAIICGGWGFYLASDRRIKKDIQDINDASALEKLRTIRPRTFKYIDVAERGDKDVYGFIAQEVAEVLPEAVTTNFGFIPNIYVGATIGNGGSNLTLATPCSSNLDTSSLNGKPLKLQAYDRSGVQHELIVGEILDGSTVRLAEPGKFEDGTEVFVVGQEVHDLKVVKHESIFSVGIAAVQEVDRQVTEIDRQLQAALARVATLEGTVADLVQRLAAAGIA
jgi:hypothetical protein